MRVVLFSFIVAFAQIVEANGLVPDRIYIPLASKHFKVESEEFGVNSWNEINPGLVLSWEDRFASLDLDLNFGVFKNSYNDWSSYVSLSKFWDLSEEVAFGTFLAFADYHSNSDYFDFKVGDYAMVLGFQLNAKNLFFQVQPVPTDNGIGAVFATGVSFGFPK